MKCNTIKKNLYNLVATFDSSVLGFLLELCDCDFIIIKNHKYLCTIQEYLCIIYKKRHFFKFHNKLFLLWTNFVHEIREKTFNDKSFWKKFLKFLLKLLYRNQNSVTSFQDFSRKFFTNHFILVVYTMFLTRFSVFVRDNMYALYN